MNVFLRIYHWKIALLAYFFYGRPARKLIVIGVTGTKGKSSTCRFIASALEAAGHKVGLLSTVEFQIGDKRWPNSKKMTMLGRGQIQKMLRDMVSAGCKYAVVETSSEGILQFRHTGLCYDVAVFTNLGSEHSERHGGFDNLKRDKGKIFAGLAKQRRKIISGKIVQKTIIVNADDPHAQYFMNFKADNKLTFGVNNTNADVRGKITESSIEKTIINVQGRDYEINVPGDFNAYNALAAIAVARSQGISDKTAADGVASVRGIAGRMEFVDCGQPFRVVVDYAHEPMSLNELFSNLRRFAPANKIIGVIGSDGGGRDVAKRAEMGGVAGRLADVVVVTDVNCYDEDPAQIAEMIAQGVRKSGKVDGTNLFVEIDRKRAIEKAVAMAKSGDIVAITAKGTEPYIASSRGKKIPWDDKRAAVDSIKYVLAQKT